MNQLTPKDRHCYPIAIKTATGNIKNAENLCTSNREKTTTLRYESGGEKPKIILDLGGNSPGGYPFFRLKSRKGTPKLRLAYSDWYDYLIHPVHGENGDFIRGCCKYLGVELPVLPGNPNRFEQYNLTRNGLYTYPLVQGQQRFILICLETPDTEVELEEIYIYYTSDMQECAGTFQCSDEDLNRLWDSSIYTIQIATLSNSQSFDCADGKMMLRALTKGCEIGIYREGLEYKDCTFSFDGEIAHNPHGASGIGWVMRSTGLDNGYLFRLDEDGTFHRFIRKNNVNYEKYPSLTVSFPVIANKIYQIQCVAKGNTIKNYINGIVIDTFVDDSYLRGTVGFYQTVEKWAVVENIYIESENYFYTENCDNLDAWEFTRSLPFLADGAKRDRLPWSGDLDWAGRNAYYGFGDYQKIMADTLRIFARHQTPEGYIWGTCYPENTQPCRRGEYGYYESDLFSAWVVPTLADYVLFCDDRAGAEELYDSIVVRNLDYLWSYVEKDGLHYQRYETSKGLWDHVLNDIGKFTYNNMVICDAMQEGAFLANYLGKKADAAEFTRRETIMKQAIMTHFWEEEKGYFIKGIGRPELCDMANSLALSLAFVDEEKANRILPQIREHSPWHGKIFALLIRGMYHYEKDEMAIDALRHPNRQVNWIDFLKDDRGPDTTNECMQYPEGSKDRIWESSGGMWGDMSHPDTAIAHILSAYILGVLPTAPGFSSFEINPMRSGLTYAAGKIPTKYGLLSFAWEQKETGFFAQLDTPENLPFLIKIRRIYGENPVIIVNGKVKAPKSTDEKYFYFV